MGIALSNIKCIFVGNERDLEPMNANTDDNQDRSDSSEVPHLDVKDWDPPPKAKLQNGNEEKSNSSSKHVSLGKSGLTYEEIIQNLEEKIKDLLKRTNFVTSEVRSLLKFIHRQTRYSPDVLLNKRIVENIVKFGIAHVFLRVWESVSKVEYLLNENVLAYKNLETILSIIWNCSDKSPSLCDAISRCGLIQTFMAELASDKLSKSDLSNENYLYLVKGYMGILHNIIRLCTDSRKLFRSCGAVKTLRAYLDRQYTQSLVKTKAYLILSYIINEEENDLINATDDHIRFILDILKEALDSENHFSKPHAFWAAEITCGLNHLAINDSNKVRMGRLGAFPLYLKLVQSANVEEQNLGAAGLWILSFKDENKQILRQQPECLQELQSLATSSASEGIRRAARGALWVVRTAPAGSSTQTTPERRVSQAVASDVDSPHIMISYHWASQEVMIKVKDKLKAAGYKVWMDIDNMSGSTLEAMALAVERAAVILVCMSQGFKDSPSCRTEAEYTFRLRKDIVPLVLQQDYSPDGWLGMMVGTRLHFDFSAKENISTELPRLIKELGPRGRMPYRQAGRQLMNQSVDSLEGMASGLQSSTSVSSLHSYMNKSTRVMSWDREDVGSWLEDLGLVSLAEKLQVLDGPLLLQYKKMMDSAPQYFYHTLEDNLRLDLPSILQFTKALDGLK